MFYMAYCVFQGRSYELLNLGVGDIGASMRSTVVVVLLYLLFFSVGQISNIIPTKLHIQNRGTREESRK